MLEMFNVCAFLITVFYFHGSVLLNESSLSVAAIWQFAQTFVLKTKDMSVSRTQLREKRPREVLVCHML